MEGCSLYPLPVLQGSKKLGINRVNGKSERLVKASLTPRFSLKGEVLSEIEISKLACFGVKTML